MPKTNNGSCNITGLDDSIGFFQGFLMGTKFLRQTLQLSSQVLKLLKGIEEAFTGVKDRSVNLAQTELHSTIQLRQITLQMVAQVFE